MTQAAHDVQHALHQDAQNAVKEDNAAATPFRRIGGAPSVDRLVEAFYACMDSLPAARAIRSLHAADLSATKEMLKRYLGEWMGGPPLYSQERGHPRLRQRHLRFKIGEAERDAWLSCMQQALDEVIDDIALRDELLGSFAKLADWMRNQPDNPHDRTAAGTVGRT
jgi:hemoglobin